MQSGCNQGSSGCNQEDEEPRAARSTCRTFAHAVAARGRTACTQGGDGGRDGGGSRQYLPDALAARGRTFGRVAVPPWLAPWLDVSAEGASDLAERAEPGRRAPEPGRDALADGAARLLDDAEWFAAELSIARRVGRTPIAGADAAEPGRETGAPATRGMPRDGGGRVHALST